MCIPAPDATWPTCGGCQQAHVNLAQRLWGKGCVVCVRRSLGADRVHDTCGVLHTVLGIAWQTGRGWWRWCVMCMHGTSRAPGLPLHGGGLAC